MIKPDLATTARQQALVLCHDCLTLNGVNNRFCKRCQSRLHSRTKNSLQQTVALLLTGLLLYIPANLFPIMHTQILGRDSANTIVEGVILFWQQESYPIAAIIFIASVIVPLGKMLALGWLCFGVAYDRLGNARKQMTLYRITEFIGRWSMVDVFVVSVLVALVQIGHFMSIVPGIAAISFAAMVIITMVAAMKFDPRLIWDPKKNN